MFFLLSLSKWFLFLVAFHFSSVSYKWGVRLHANFSFYPVSAEEEFYPFFVHLLHWKFNKISFCQQMLLHSDAVVFFWARTNAVSEKTKTLCWLEQQSRIRFLFLYGCLVYARTPHTFTLFVSQFFIWSYVNCEITFAKISATRVCLLSLKEK